MFNLYLGPHTNFTDIIAETKEGEIIVVIT